MKKFNAKKYDGYKYDYHGNVYECITTNYIMNDDTVCVCLQNVNDDTFILIDVDKWLDFHHKYLITEKENRY